MDNRSCQQAVNFQRFILLLLLCERAARQINRGVLYSRLTQVATEGLFYISSFHLEVHILVSVYICSSFSRQLYHKLSRSIERHEIYPS